jgi:hypothetical protein
MRVDGPDGETMSFDNMGSRPITGTTEWRQYRIVLDVPETADLIALGVLLQGPGRVWIDDVEVERVTSDIPTTGGQSTEPLPAMPANLDFELTEEQ